MSDKQRRLTARQTKFISEYLLCLNATRAAIRAGYSKKTARQMGSENLSKPYIQERIQNAFKEQQMTPDEILARLADHARGDMGDMIDEHTMSVDWAAALKNGKTHLVKKIKQTIITKDDEQVEILELELHDPQKALVSLGRTYALFADKLKVEISEEQKLIDHIKAGDMAYEALEEAYDSDLATKLFRLAGVEVTSGSI